MAGTSLTSVAKSAIQETFLILHKSVKVATSNGKITQLAKMHFKNILLTLTAISIAVVRSAPVEIHEVRPDGILSNLIPPR
jgi:hypothetical protein